MHRFPLWSILVTAFCLLLVAATCPRASGGPFVLDQLVFVEAPLGSVSGPPPAGTSAAPHKLIRFAFQSPVQPYVKALYPASLDRRRQADDRTDNFYFELRQIADPDGPPIERQPMNVALAEPGPRLFGAPAEQVPADDDATADDGKEVSPMDDNPTDASDDRGAEAAADDAEAAPSQEEATTEDEALTADGDAVPEEQPADDTPEESGSHDSSPEQQSTNGPEWVGERLAPGMMVLVQQEIAAGLQRRGIVDNFQRFRAYAAHKLDSTAGDRRTSEVTGNCRLNWYDHLLRNPLEAPVEAEEFTRELHRAFLTPQALGHVTNIAAGRLDLRKPNVAWYEKTSGGEDALGVVRHVLAEVQLAYAAAMAPLKPSELRELHSNLYQILTAECRIGHTLSRRSTGRRLCDLMERRMDRPALMDAAGQLVPLAEPHLLDQLRAIPEDGSVEVAGASGRILRRIETPAGDIIIGGRDQNTYHLDEMASTNVVIDLGGDDVYVEGTCSLRRPVLIILDLGGNDGYKASSPGVQGGAILGVSMLLDAAGDDVYQAKDVAQGSCIGGVGILMDLAGNDTYVGVRRLQGQAIAGLGLLVDRGGNDRYHAAMWAQGFGGPMGFGVLEDVDGQDHYYAGGLYLDSYEETPGYEGWSQGVGAGIRAVADGGIGAILDGGGNDTYEFDYISHGGGYWLGLGFARDFAGDDQRLGATRLAYNGSQRSERRFQRFSNGFGCHYALGFTFDDAGNDAYDGTIMGLGFAWDCAVAYLCDLAGDDQYLATGGGTQGNGAQAGLGVLFDYHGDDTYRGYGQGRASSSISYHDLPGCGGNFSFVIDYGGEDKYGCGARNNSYIQRGASGGFLIDRPKREETEETANTHQEEHAAGS